MNTTNPIKSFYEILGIISFCIPVLIILFILNWFLGVIPLQKLEGMPLFLPIFTSPIGIILALISFILSQNKFAKWAILLNVLLFFLPGIYFYYGTLIFGP